MFIHIGDVGERGLVTPVSGLRREAIVVEANGVVETKISGMRKLHTYIPVYPRLFPFISGRACL